MFLFSYVFPSSFISCSYRRKNLLCILWKGINTYIYILTRIRIRQIKTFDFNIFHVIKMTFKGRVFMCIWMTIMLWFRKSSRCRTWQKREKDFYLFNQYQITMFPHDDGLLCWLGFRFLGESGSVITDKMSFRWR